jgi:Predicted membrane protein/domain
MNAETSDYTDGGRQDNACPPPLFHGYAGFWKRAIAAFIDGLVISFFVMIALCSIHGIDYEASTHAGKNIERIGQAIGITIYWLYFALFESSPVQATFGKMAVGIKVIGAAGNRISFGRASARHFCKISSTVLFLAGYAMAAFTKKKQGLHDIMAGCLVVNKKVYTRTQTFVVVAAAVTVVITPLLTAALLPAIGNAVLQANMTAMGTRAQDICVAIMSEDAAINPDTVCWPKSGKQMEEGDDISKMRFENSSDYFTVLVSVVFDRERTDVYWDPHFAGYHYYPVFAGAGVPAKEGTGRLTAENNAWTIAANVTDDMPDLIPLIITRNVDPASLIPREGDLHQQFIRPSEKFKTPFGNKGFVLVRKGGVMFKSTWKYASLGVLYQNASGEELQKIRDAFQKIEYLEP